MNQFTRRLKYIHLNDLFEICSLILGYFLSLFLRIAHRNIWLVCERREEARDNGYWFFKYLCEYHPEVEAVYAIDKSSPDYAKVAVLGRVIPFGSLMHWTYYWAARRNISSQKNGKPNAALCFLLEVYLDCRKNRVFLQHGIIKDDLRWLYYDVTRMNLFVCAATPEYRYVKERFGYPEGAMQLCGLCRYDNLRREHEVKRQIVVMPTQREWIAMGTSKVLECEGSNEFTDSEFYKVWSSFLNNRRLADLLEKYDMDLVFYPHAEMQPFACCFETADSRIHLGLSKDFDVQQLLMESSVLITDYSSVFTDFAYMQKPMLFYQFDYEKYRTHQYQEGYFSYESDGFGPVAYSEDSLLDNLEHLLASGAVMEEKYRERTRNFFAFHDDRNCERTYEAIVAMK